MRDPGRVICDSSILYSATGDTQMVTLTSNQDDLVNMTKAHRPHSNVDESVRRHATYETISSYVPPRPELGGLVSWQSLPDLYINAEIAKRALLVSKDRNHGSSAAFDILRTRVMQEMRDNGWTSIGITSPTAGCGSSVVALNLAFSLAHQKECRTLLLDLDLRNPSIAGVLEVKHAPPLGEFLSGNGLFEEHFRRYGDNLALGLNSTRTAGSAELLQSSATAGSLDAMRQYVAPNIVIYVLPATLPSDDVAAFLPNLDCAVIVARAGHSTIDEIHACEQILAEKTNVVGVVLNRCRFPQGRFGYTVRARE